MTPLAALKAAVAELKKRKLEYCLIGGHAASLYRINERVTKDVDFVVVADPPENSKKIAAEVISAIGLKPIFGFIPNLKDKKKSGKICLVSSTPKKGSLTGIIDILLPEQPWVKDAVNRAQFNVIDLGFDKVPVITPEDLIIAKCYALSNSPDRFQDLDDLKEIFAAITDLDFDYISLKLEQHTLDIPGVLKSYTPKILKRFAGALSILKYSGCCV